MEIDDPDSNDNIDNYEDFKKKYPTLCVLPFIQTCCNGSGIVQMCNRSGQIDKHHVAFSDIDDIRNNETLRSNRKSMLQGEQLSVCKRCIDEEHTGHLSKRQRENQRFWYKALPYIKTAENNDGYIQEKSIYWDIKLGNVCNFSCMYCTDNTSTSYYAESVKLDKAGVLPNWREPYYQQVKNDLSSDRKFWTQWFEDDKFWDRFNEHLDSIDTIFFEGGEPTLNPKVHEFAERAVRSNVASNINIKFATNLSGITPKLLDNLCQFRKVQLIISIDGLKEIQEYIRWGSDWNIIEEKWDLVMSYKNKNLIPILLPCINILNVENLIETIEWAKQWRRDFQFGINYLERPEIMHINNIPESRRLEIRDKIWQWWSEQTQFTDPQSTVEMRGLYNILSTENNNKDENLNGLRTYLKALDNIRGTDYHKIWNWL